MTNLFYSTVPNKVRVFVDAIPSTGVPAKLSLTELAARGFKSSNDRSILPVLKAIGLVDGNGVPTENWQAFRNRDTNKALMARLVRTAYADLFNTYPDADRRTDQEIKNFFGTRTRAGDRALQYAVATFRALVGLSDFGASGESDVMPARQVAEAHHSKAAQPRVVATHPPLHPAVTINVGIQIPEAADAAMIDQIFRSMAVHLYGKVDDE